MRGQTDLHANRETRPFAAIKKIPSTSAAFAELGSEVLGTGKHLRFQAHGGSMRPLIRDGDVLFVEPINADQNCKIGQVVFCRTSPGRVVVHRVIQEQSQQGKVCYYLVQGDQAPEPDGWIPSQDILGRLAAIERDGQKFDMASPTMKVLNRIALWRSRYRLDRHWLTRSAGLALKHLPCLSRYFS